MHPVGNLEEDADAILGVHFDNRKVVRGLVVDLNRGGHLGPAPLEQGRAARLLHDARHIDRSGQDLVQKRAHALPFLRVHDERRPPSVGNAKDIENDPVARRRDPRIQNIQPGGGKNPGDASEKPGAILGANGHLAIFPLRKVAHRADEALPRSCPGRRVHRTIPRFSSGR